MDISKFTFQGTSLSSTTTAEDMLPILKMPVFLRKGGKNILNIYWIRKFITRETSPAQLHSSFLVINSSMGKMSQILTATREKIRLLKIHSTTPMFHYTLCRADGKMMLYPLGLLQGANTNALLTTHLR